MLNWKKKNKLIIINLVIFGWVYIVKESWGVEIIGWLYNDDENLEGDILFSGEDIWYWS